MLLTTGDRLLDLFVALPALDRASRLAMLLELTPELPGWVRESLYQVPGVERFAETRSLQESELARVTFSREPAAFLVFLGGAAPLARQESFELRGLESIAALPDGPSRDRWHARYIGRLMPHADPEMRVRLARDATNIPEELPRAFALIAASPFLAQASVETLEDEHRLDFVNERLRRAVNAALGTRWGPVLERVDRLAALLEEAGLGVLELELRPLVAPEVELRSFVTGLDADGLLQLVRGLLALAPERSPRSRLAAPPGERVFDELARALEVVYWERIYLQYEKGWAQAEQHDEEFELGAASVRYGGMGEFVGARAQRDDTAALFRDDEDSGGGFSSDERDDIAYGEEAGWQDTAEPPASAKTYPAEAPPPPPQPSLPGRPAPSAPHSLPGAGYAPPAAGFPPPAGGSAPPGGGYPSPAAGYPPPAAARYPPPGAGYPQASAPPPPQAGGLPSSGARPNILTRTGIAARSLFRRKQRKRVVNLGFASVDRPMRPLSRFLPLRSDCEYYFWVEVGQRLRRSIASTRASLPAALREGARLQVVVFHYRDEFEGKNRRMTGWLRLTADGAVVEKPAEVPSALELRPEHRLFFSVKTPRHKGSCRLRCCVYHKQVLLQSHIVTVRVRRTRMPLRGRLSSRVDYLLSSRLDERTLDGLTEHTLSIMLNDNTATTHGFRFVGRDDFAQDAEMAGAELRSLVDAVRKALRSAAWGDEDPWDASKRPQNYGTTDLAPLRNTLVTLAIRGYRMYGAIVERLAGGPDAQDALQDLMRAPGTIQIALKHGATDVFPAAAIYDYSFNTNARNIVLCPDFEQALTSGVPLVETSCFQGTCRTPDLPQPSNVVCPGGFWGFRHRIGIPLSVNKDAEIVSAIPYRNPTVVAFCVSLDPNLKERESHLAALSALSLGVRLELARSWTEAFHALRDATNPPRIVYFYCHGGTTLHGIPYLQVGSDDDDKITPDNFRAMKVRWPNINPLVVLNGCHTTAITPESILNMVSVLVQYSEAAGVVGTEISIFESLACPFAERLFARLLEGKELGEAVRETRLELLAQGNPLGLVYVPFAHSGLHLAPKSNWPAIR